MDKLLSQVKEAGLPHTKAGESISNDDKNALLQFLRRSHGDRDATVAAPKKITLKRKTVGTLKSASTHGRGKTVNVEVRKKRTYVKRSVVEDEPELETEEVPAEEEVLETAAEAAPEAEAKTDAVEGAPESEESPAPEEEKVEAPAEATPEKPVPDVPVEEAAAARADKPGAKRKTQGKKEEDSGDRKSVV